MVYEILVNNTRRNNIIIIVITVIVIVIVMRIAVGATEPVGEKNALGYRRRRGPGVRLEAERSGTKRGGRGGGK